MEDIELSQSKKKVWSTFIRTTLEGNNRENAWNLDSKLLNIEHLNERVCAFNGNDKNGVSNSNRAYWILSSEY